LSALNKIVIPVHLNFSKYIFFPVPAFLLFKFWVNFDKGVDDYLKFSLRLIGFLSILVSFE